MSRFVSSAQNKSRFRNATNSTDDDSEASPRNAEPPPQQQHRRAAQATVDALIFSLRQRGEAALSERDIQRRLADLSSDQIREVIARLIKLRSTYPAVTDDLLFRLGGQMS